MYKDKSILVVVPARGGSKGIKFKNIYPLAGKPLIAYTAETISLLDFVDRAVVSTDNEKIGDIAKQYGLSVPFLRPPELSEDIVSDWDVLVHALLKTEQADNRKYDVILMLQPTCPLRKTQHVKDALNRLVEGGYDSVWTLSPTDSKAHPLKQLVLQGDLIEYYDPQGANIIARQQLKTVYHVNGAAYAITRECLLEKKSKKGDRCSAIIIEEQLANIDTEQDIAFAEFLLQQKQI